MCNATALITTAAVGGALFTGGSSLGLLGAEGAAAGAGTAAAAGTTAATTSALATYGTYASVAAAGLGAYGSYQQAQTNQAVAKSNAALAEYKAQDDQTQAQKQAILAQQRGSVLEGSQRAAMSARGLDLSEGTPANILGQTEFFTMSDAATARTNGARAAYSDRAQENTFNAQADGQNPGLTLAGSLLGGGATVASKWYQYNRGG